MSRQLAERLRLGGQDVGQAGIAQDIDVEAIGASGGIDVGHHGIEVANHPVG